MIGFFDGRVRRRIGVSLPSAASEETEMLARTLAAASAATLRLIGAIVRDRRGVTAVFLAVTLIPITGAVGLAINSSIGYLLRTRMGKSLDAAGLAAGRMALDADAEEVAQQYFDANFQGGGRVEVTDFDFAVNSDANTVTLTAQATTPTVFMRIFGHDTMVVSARTVIQRETTGMELALVLDNTGSMYGANFDAMKAAADDLIKIVFGAKTEVDNVWVSLVPYVATVNVGTSHTDWLDKNDQVLKTPSVFGSKSDGTGYGWKGCVMAQAYPLDTGNSTPSTHALSSFLYPKAIDNNWPQIDDAYTSSNETRKGPNLGCGTAITPLTASRSKIQAGLDAMRSWRRGGTTGNLGLAWGWRTISPKWRGLWGDAALPLDYEAPFMEKVVVILTDGDNTFYDLPYTVDSKTKKVTSPGDTTTPSDYTAYGRLNAPGPVGLAKSTTADGVKVLNSRMTEVCTAMKAEKIRIYTIIFGTGPSATTQKLYEDCATTPAMYYWAKNNSEIGNVFKSIGGQLANLRILE